MAHIEVDTTVEIDTDEIIGKISTPDLIDELKIRGLKYDDIQSHSYKDYTLFEVDKIKFFMENLNQIELSDLEKLANR